MDKPTVLLIDDDDARRKTMADGLTRFDYEVVPASDLASGVRFAETLTPSVVIAPTRLLAARGGGDPQIAILEALATIAPTGGRTTALLIGHDREQLPGLPDHAHLLPVSALDDDQIIHRIRLAVVGHLLELDVSSDLRSLVGELALLPTLELLRGMNRLQLTARIELIDGMVAMLAGRVVAARAGVARGIKAVCRLGRRADGPFHLFLHASGDSLWSAGESDQDAEIDMPFTDLLIRAIEDAQVPLPDRRTWMSLRRDINTRSTELSAQQRRMLEVVARCGTVGALFDALPASDGKVAEALQRLVQRGVVSLHKARAAVAVVTDSTADLPPDLAREYEIRVVPLKVRFGDHTFHDGVDIQPRDFYHLLETDESHPETAPPTEAEFLEHYQSLGEHQDIVSIHISGKLSQTLVHAHQAADNGLVSIERQEGREECALEVVDGGSVGIGTGMLAIFAARMALRGEKVFAIAHRLRSIVPRMHLFFVVNTFDYLVRGGRVGKARAAIGRLLNIKPILTIQDGEFIAIDKVRGGRRAHPRIVDLISDRVDPKRPLMAAVAHAKAPVWGDRLRTLLGERFDVLDMLMSDIGPTVGTHAGPGAVGAVVFQPSEEEWPLLAPLTDDELAALEG
ncbi:MAG: DegV family protein [Acidobacteriota bacterium]